MFNALRANAVRVGILAVCLCALQLYGCSDDSVKPTPSPPEDLGWSRQDSLDKGTDLFSVSLKDASTGTAVGDYGTIIRTTDGGRTWVSRESGTSFILHAVTFDNENNGMAVGAAGTILRTTDGGQTWVSQESGTSEALFDVWLADTTAIAVGENGTILLTMDSGQRWRVQKSGTTKDLHALALTDPIRGTIVGEGGTILRIGWTRADGYRWNNVQDSGTRTRLRDITFTDVEADTGVIVGDVGTILKTTDGGETWVVQWSQTTARLRGVSFTHVDTGTVVGDVGTILRTTDGGETWVAQKSGTEAGLYAVSFTDTKTGTAVGTFGRILHTTTGGE